MNPLLDPNVAYLLLVIGVVLGILALFSPGTGILEIGALFTLFLSGYGAVNLDINAWAIGVLLLGIVPFIFAIRKARNWPLLIASIIVIIIGSVFLFRTENGSPAVNFWLALVTSLVASGILWFIGRKGLEAISMAKDFDLSRLIGLVGVARTQVFTEGTVYVQGEEWSAFSDQPIQSGMKVRVIERNGLMLKVEPAEQVS
jgi:membrane-bound serine protease (ClpP class)